jgi:type I restriction enzyme S subunit
MPELRTVRIGDLGRVVTGKTPPSSQPELFGDLHPFLTPTDIDGFARYIEPARFLSPEGSDYQHRLMLPERAVCVVCIGATIGKVCMTGRPSFTNQQINSVVVNENEHDPFFVYHLMTTLRDELKSNAGGAATPIINKTAFSEIEVSVPPLPVQRRIAGILSAYDELMENSQRRIRLLEAMARALYREWFVHFRFPGHEKHPRVATPLGDIPQGWEVRTVKDVATVTYGFPFASKKFNTDRIGTPVIRIRDILDGSINTFTDEEADPKYHIKNGDILVGMDGDFHMCIWSSGHAFQNQRVAKFESNGEIGNYHLFLALVLPIQTWNKSIVGTTVAHLGDMHIKTIQIAWPPAKILAKAREILEPMAEQIIALKRQIQNLRRTRDLLLPRLLSGQVELETEAA